MSIIKKLIQLNNQYMPYVIAVTVALMVIFFVIEEVIPRMRRK